MSGECAYSTTAPEVLSAYRQAVHDAKAQAKKIQDAVEALGVSPQVYVRSTGFGNCADEITALLPQGEFVPDGWRLSKTRGVLEPRRGKPGELARQWLAEHQPVDIRHVMERHGLPRASWIPGDGFNYRVVKPRLFEQGGVLWACYVSEPGASDSGFDTQKCTWPRCKLSEFYAAYETYMAAQGGDPS